MTSVLEALSEAGLYLKPEKSKFHKEMRYLRLIIERGKIKMDHDKVAEVQYWPSIPALSVVE